MPKVGEMFLEISANNSKLRANLAEASSLIRDWSLLVTGLTSGITNAFRTIADIGIKAIQISLVTLAGAFGLAAKTGADFEDAMVRTFAILREGSQDAQRSFMSLTNTALNLGRDTLFSATQAAEGMQILAKAGFDAREIMDSIKPAVDLAIVGNIQLAESSGFLVSALRSFNLETSQAKRVVDVLALGASQANTTITELGSALSFVAPVAAGAGLSLEETIATLGILADRGIKGSKAGTTLRRAITQLIAPTGRAKKILDELGLSFVDSAGNAKSLETVILELNKAGVTTAQTMEIFGLRAGPGMVALMKAGSDAIGQFEQKLKDSQGAADRMSQMLRTSVKGRVRDLIASIDLLGKSFSQKFNKPLADTIFAIRNYIIRLNDAGNRMGVFRSIVEGVMKSMKPLTDLIKEGAKEFLKFISELTPQEVSKFFETLREKVERFVNIIKSDEFRKTLIETFNIAISLANTFIGTLKNIIALWRLLPETIRPSATAIGIVTTAMLKLFGGILNVIIFAISLRAVLITLGGQAAAIGAAIFSWKTGLVVASAFFEVILIALAAIALIFATIKFREFLKSTQIIGKLWEGTKATLVAIKELILGIFRFIKGDEDPFAKFREAVDKVKMRIQALRDVAKETIDKVKEFIPKTIKQTGEAIIAPVKGFVNKVTGRAKESANAVKDQEGFIDFGGERIAVGKAGSTAKTMNDLLLQSGDLATRDNMLSQIEELGRQIQTNLNSLKDDQVAERAALTALKASLIGLTRKTNRPAVDRLDKSSISSSFENIGD